MKIGYLMQAGAPDVRQYPLSGPANHVKNIVEALRALDHEVCLIALRENGIWKSRDLENFDHVRLPLFDDGPLRLLERAARRMQHELRLPYAAFFESMRFARACVRELPGFDMLYERTGWFGYGGVWASRILKIPLIYEVNGDLLTELKMKGMDPGCMQRALSLFLMKRAARMPACTVSTGEGWRRRYIDQWKVPAETVIVVENGSELVELLRREDLRAFKDEAPIEPTVLVYVGAFEPWHGLPTLIRASARGIERGLPIRLVIIGSGREAENIVDLINSLEIAPSVTLTGNLPPSELAQRLACCDIGISAYHGRVEYSGLKLLDYKAAGLAVIASGEGGHPAVIRDGRTGHVVPPGDVDALYEAICNLVQNPDLRREMGRRARIEAEERHSWRHTAEKLQTLFRSFAAPSLKRK